MELKVLEEKVKASELKGFAENWYFDFLKGCVDLENNKVAIGGDYHMETCELLSSLGGNHADIWGFNLRFLEDETILEFDSLVNIKPQVNKSRVVESSEIRDSIAKVVKKYIEF